MSGGGLSYKDAGVDVAGADSLVHQFKTLAQGTLGESVVHHASHYAGLFRLNTHGMQDPLLAATCDGVGTKLLVAKQAGHYQGLGQDLVAMSVNDLLPLGAKPLLFLDYIATGALDKDVLSTVVGGIANACRDVGCALLGGETAEMPGLYQPHEFDLAGFAVGLVDGATLPDPTTIAPGDVLLGLPSSGIHSNGFSLARKALFDVGGRSLNDELAHFLLAPTRLYVADVLALLRSYHFKGAAHITGGGLLGRLKKLAPRGLTLQVDPQSFASPGIFSTIAEAGGVSPEEMARTFNMGLGFVVIVSPETARGILQQLPQWLQVGQVAEAALPEIGVQFGSLRA